MAQPETTMGTRMDGSPWVIHVDFGADVQLNAEGKIVDRRRTNRPLTAAEARDRAAAFVAAAEWVESGRSAELEQRA